MHVFKVLMQSVVVVLWAVYVAPHVDWSLQGIPNGAVGPTGWIDLLGAYLQAVPVEAITVPTIAMALIVIGLEVVFGCLERKGSHS